MHYVSTCPVSTDIEHEKSGKHIHLSPKSKRQNRAAYMNEYRKATDSPEKRATCNNHLMRNKFPPCAIANGMGFPMKPEFFDLNKLECRLLAPRIAFQKLIQAPQGRQLKIHGNIVNVPADVTHTVTMLPQLHSQTATIKVNLKHKLQYKSSALSLNVRPDKVVQAAK